MIIEISFDPSYQCGISTPHLAMPDHETFLGIIRCIPDGQKFEVGHIDDGKVTGRGTYMADKDQIFVVHETGTCCLERQR